MKSYRARALNNHIERAIHRERVTAQVQAQTPAPKVGNRRQRRQMEVLNRRLASRLKKDGTPATVKVLDDGGIHVSADMRGHPHDDNCAHDEEDE
jgi:hypothetical protein